MAELEATQGEPTGTEYGVYWPSEGEVERAPYSLLVDGGERHARHVVAQHKADVAGPVLVARTLGPWRPVNEDGTR